MRKVLLFCEDTGHAKVIQGLLERLAAEHEVEILPEVRSARGGHGKMLHELSVGCCLIQVPSGLYSAKVVLPLTKNASATDTKTCSFKPSMTPASNRSLEASNTLLILSTPWTSIAWNASTIHSDIC
jgi:hypothetical protein